MQASISEPLAGLEPYEWLMPLAPWESASVLNLVLASLEAQTCPAQALVVSVDGQLPAALAQVLSKCSLPIRLLEASHWQGTGATLARGLEACQTHWVLRCDADDWSHPQRAERQLRYLARHPELAVLGCQLTERGWQDPAPCSVRRVPTATAEIERLMRWRNPINHPTVALSRPAVLAVGNYRARPAFEDWDLWLRLAVHGATFANLPQALVTASVGEAHLARRHGKTYFKREARFFLACAREGLLPAWNACLLLITRLPWRLLPEQCLASVMDSLRSARTNPL